MAKLELRPLGNTRLKLSCVGFGASPLGNVFSLISEEDAVASVHEAFRLGINFFDTSPYYVGTLSETVLGKALQDLGVNRDEFVVSTKCGRYVEGFDFSAERVTRSVDESLVRLKLDYVDILQCHDIEFGFLDQIFRLHLQSPRYIAERDILLRVGALESRYGKLQSSFRIQINKGCFTKS